jgi:hypothetical protein
MTAIRTLLLTVRDPIEVRHERRGRYSRDARDMAT